jgi:predicted DNA-binding transcriptional regulator AlpA
MSKALLKLPVARMRLGNISPATFYRRIKDDPKFPKILKIGSSSFISDCAIDEYIEHIEALAEDDEAA